MPGPYFRESDLDAQQKLSELDFQNEARRPETFNARWKQAAYWAMVELIDANVGRMLKALEQSGQAEETIVIFTSNHGEMLGDHGLIKKGCRFYDGLTRVPLLMRWPDRFSAGLQSDPLVELTDLAPTLLDAAGLDIPPDMRGRSLAPILRGESNPHHHRDHVRCEYFAALPRGQHPKPNTGSRGTMIRDRQYKLAVYHDIGYGELFDLKDDPWEFNNLWDDPACSDARFELLRQSFDELAGAVNLGPPITAGY